MSQSLTFSDSAGLQVEANRYRFFVAFIILLVSLSMRIPVLFHPSSYAPDTSFYVALARCFDQFFATGSPVDEWSGAQLDKWLPPLYPLHIAVVHQFINDPFEAAKWVSFVLGSLIPVLTFVVGLLIFESTFPATISAFLVASLPPLIDYSGQALTESTFLFYLLLLIGCFYRAVISPAKRWWAALGLTMGLAYLTRQSGIGFVPLVTFWTLVFASVNGWRWGRAIANLLISICIFVLVTMPYSVHLNRRWGKVTLIPLAGLHPLINLIYFTDDLQKTNEELRSVIPDLKTMYSYKLKVVSGKYEPVPYLNGSTDKWNSLDFFLKHPGILFPVLIRNCSTNLRYLHDFDLILPSFQPVPSWIYFLLIYLPLIVGAWRKKWTPLGMCKAGFLVSIILLQWGGYSIAYSYDRYMNVVHPLIILLIVGGLFEVDAWVGEMLCSRQGKPFPWRQACLRKTSSLIYVSLFTICLWPHMIQVMTRPPMTTLDTWRHVARLVAKHSDGQSVITLAQTPEVSTLTAGQNIFMPFDEDYQTIVDFACRQGIGFIIADRRSLELFLDNHGSLQQKQTLDLIFRDRTGEDARMLVYQVQRNCL